MINIGTLLVVIALCVGICWPRDTRFIPNKDIHRERITPRFINR